MSIEMDVGVSAPGAGFGTAEAEPEAVRSNWDEGTPMVIATVAGVLAASLLAVCVYLS